MKIQVNEIKSVYGKTGLKQHLMKHMSLNQLYILDIKKAEMLSRVLGLQLPTTLITSSRVHNIPSPDQNVNTEYIRSLYSGYARIFSY